MSNEIIPAAQSKLPSLPTSGGRIARQTSRALAAIDQQTEIAIAKAQAVADVQQAGVDAVARTGAYAMQQTALVSNLQQQLALAAPAASGDLDYIKTVTVMGMAQVVTDTTRRIGRQR